MTPLSLEGFRYKRKDVICIDQIIEGKALMTSLSLTHRLQALAESYKQTIHLIQELQRFPNSPVFSIDTNPDEKRIEVANEIHLNLKEQEDSLEFLRQEVDENDSDGQSRRNVSSRTDEHERNAATLARLNEDVKSARTAFRRAQLQAKRNADIAKRKEREELFADRLNTEQPPTRRDGQKKLTQDELALNAAEDVTRSLRRAHELLSGNLQQSEFAQQTLDESQSALMGLAENYGGTSDLLRSSRGLVSQLARSQKSDTWFLMSSVYILMVTLAWLIFRRLFYGPMWWLVWQPLKFLWYLTFTSLAALGSGLLQSQNSIGSVSVFPLDSSDVPTNAPDIQFRSSVLSPKGGAWGGDSQPPVPESPEMVEAVGKMTEEASTRVILIDRDPEASPINRMKRMHEEEIRKDEL